MKNLIPDSNNGKALSPLQKKMMDDIISHETHWMTRIFPSKLDKEKMQYQTKLYKLQAGSDYEMIKMYREASHQAFREALETMLINGKAKTRKERAEYFTQQSTILEQSIMAATDQFIEMTHNRLERLVNITHILLLDLEKQAIEESISLFYSSIENMRNRFHDILKEGVQK